MLLLQSKWNEKSNASKWQARTLDKKFAKHFGLELDRVEFLDSNGQKYGWITSSSF
jgi:hypothetical protein